MLREYESVIPLVANPNGWTKDNVVINHNPAPIFSDQMSAVLEKARQETQNKRTPFGDFNAPKAAVRQLAIQGDTLTIDTALTEYFVLWGLDKVAPEIHQQALDQLKTDKATQIPMGISTHNIVLLTPNGYKSRHNSLVLMIVNDPRHGFAPGRLSVSYEGQLDPTKDKTADNKPSTFATVRRTLYEEFCITTVEDMRLLAVCAEKGSAYTSWCHVVWIQGTPAELVNSYQTAPRRKDANALLVAPLQDVSTFAQHSLGYKTVNPYLVTGSLADDTTLNPHPTVPWRIDALKDYLAKQSSFIKS